MALIDSIRIAKDGKRGKPLVTSDWVGLASGEEGVGGDVVV